MSTNVSTAASAAGGGGGGGQAAPAISAASAAAATATAAAAPAFDPLDLDTPLKFNYPQTAAGKLDECVRIKGIANARFRAGLFGPAIRTYATALAYVKGLDAGGNPLNAQMAQLLGPQAQGMLAAAEESASSGDDLREEIRAQQVFLHTNIAFAYSKVGRYGKALEACSKALEMDPANPKVLMRKVDALLGLNDTAAARELLDRVAAEAGEFVGRKSLTAARKRLAAQEKKNRDKTKKAFAGMFSKKKTAQTKPAAADDTNSNTEPTHAAAPAAAAATDAPSS